MASSPVTGVTIIAPDEKDKKKPGTDQKDKKDKEKKEKKSGAVNLWSFE